MIVYTGLFINHENHRSIENGRYNDYYDSVLKLDKYFTDKKFVLFCDEYALQKLKNVYHIQNIQLVTIDYKDTLVYKTINNEIDENTIVCSSNGLSNIRQESLFMTNIIWNLKIECIKRVFDLDDNYTHVCYIDIGCLRNSRICYWKDWFDSNCIINNLQDVNITYENVDFLKSIHTKSDSGKYKNLITYGHKEIPCNSIVIGKNIIVEMYSEYILTICKLINKFNILPNEQPIFTLVISKLYNKYEIHCHNFKRGVKKMIQHYYVRIHE